MTSIVKNLGSALSSLQARFPEDPETLHLAVAAVFSSIFRAHGIDVVVVGGQAATHWLRVSGSRDVDLVSSEYHRVRDALVAAGFQTTDTPFRLLHSGPTDASSVLIELVGEVVEVAGAQVGPEALTTIEPTDIEDPAVRRLMPADALVLNPGLVFLAYADASEPESHWYDATDEGSLARDRATALLSMYRGHVVEELLRLNREGWLEDDLVERLQQRYGVLPS